MSEDKSNLEIDETTIQLMQSYTDIAICEKGSDFPYPPPAHATIREIAENDIPALTGMILETLESGHGLVTVHSLRAFKVACALNETSGNHHMAIYHLGKWDAEKFLEEIQYEDSLLIDENEREYCIAKNLFHEIVYADKDGRILLKGKEQKIYSSIPLNKKREYSKWGTLLLDSNLHEKNFLGKIADMPLNLHQRIFILHHLLKQIQLQNHDLIPILNSTLAFSSGDALVLDWKPIHKQQYHYGEFCFMVLFGKELKSCQDVMGTMLESICHSETLPDCFLNDLEQAFLNGKQYTLAHWETLLLKAKMELQLSEE
ncbi:MAG: hypothetical protein V3G42_08610 [Oscillospiraceae bacterium]